jgi:cystathionine beta-lyase
MIQYDFDSMPDRRHSESVKWLTYDQDVLPLWVADMDFLSPQPVIRALLERVEHGVFGYPKEPPDLRSLLVERLFNRYHWEVVPEDLVFLPGVITGFNLACHTLAAPDGGVLVQTPVYPPILHAAKSTGILSQEMELIRHPNGSHSIDWKAFEASFTVQTRLFILCNPHNPVGKVFQRQELERLAEICLQHGVTICSDEIHCDLVFPGHLHIPIASLDTEISNNTITLMSPSKTFNLAGLECSFAIIQNPELRKRYLAARKGLVPWVNLMGIVAARTAYKEGQDWLDQALLYLEGNRDYLMKFLQEHIPGIHMGLPEGTYLAWLDCRRTGIEGEPAQFFLDNANVAVNDGGTFGRGGEGFVRLNFGCPRAMLHEALERIKKVIPQ